MGGDHALEVVSHGGDVRALLALPPAARAWMVDRIAARAASWRFVSGALLEDLLAALGPDERSALARVVRVEACPIEMPPIRVPVQWERYVVTVGRLVAQKRLDRAISLAGRERRRIVLVGDGPERQRLESLARERDVEARFVGKVGRREALEWMAGAEEVWMASDAEGLSTVVREAAALARPVRWISS
jgi:glycosyltransferase involved in cell wall biosynthesis